MSEGESSRVGALAGAIRLGVRAVVGDVVKKLMAFGDAWVDPDDVVAIVPYQHGSQMAWVPHHTHFTVTIVTNHGSHSASGITVNDAAKKLNAHRGQHGS